MTDPTDGEVRKRLAAAAAPRVYRERTRHDHGKLDDLLVTFIRNVNLSATERVPVTLVLAGAVITGDLVSRQSWLAAVVEEIGAEPDPEQSPHVTEETARAEEYAPVYFHLRDGRVWSGDSALPSNRGVLLRGRIASVDAWFLGRLGKSTDPESGDDDGADRPA